MDGRTQLQRSEPRLYALIPSTALILIFVFHLLPLSSHSPPDRCLQSIPPSSTFSPWLSLLQLQPFRRLLPAALTTHAFPESQPFVSPVFAIRNFPNIITVPAPSSLPALRRFELFVSLSKTVLAIVNTFTRPIFQFQRVTWRCHAPKNSYNFRSQRHGNQGQQFAKGKKRSQRGELTVHGARNLWSVVFIAGSFR